MPLIKTQRRMRQRVRTLAITSSLSGQLEVVVIAEEEIVMTKVNRRLKSDLEAIQVIGNVLKRKAAASIVIRLARMKSLEQLVAVLDEKPLIKTQMRSLQILKMALTKVIRKMYLWMTDRPDQRSTSILLASLQESLRLKACKRQVWSKQTLPKLSE